MSLKKRVEKLEQAAAAAEAARAKLEQDRVVVHLPRKDGDTRPLGRFPDAVSGVVWNVYELPAKGQT